VTDGHGEPSEAIRAAVRETLVEFGFEKKKADDKKGAGDDDL
jgi:hypothetical protein